MLRGAARRLLALAALLAASFSAQAETRVAYYDVKGDTAAELREQLRRKGPLTVQGERFAARTRWKVRWHFQPLEWPGGCALRTFDVSVEADVVLPRWKKRAPAAPELVARWTEFVMALTGHESGHVALAEAAAAELRRRAAALGRRATCAELGRAVNTMGQAVLAEYQTRERRYESETAHGGTQGAKF
jgi:predicted secreted Zn-dependent protease